MITAQSLNQSGRVRHAFFTRAGGVSQGLFGSLNCGFGSGDNPDHVAANRTRAMTRLVEDAGEVGRAVNLVTLYQVHSPDVAVVEEPWDPGDAPKADAAVTNRPGVALGILTADCVPVLFADTQANSGKGVIGAAHAGWKGALGGITEATVEAMRSLGAEPSRIRAAIGPCIRQDSYEVGPEFRVRFADADPANGRFFRPSTRDGHFLFDLPGYIGRKLDVLGIAFETCAGDTCADEHRFFSYRRATHRGEQDYGRGLSAILLADG
ncbi:MAG: peptidoglycan editing factor PgeF [Rhodospirillales bacterium]|nr:peptidoglycan editing factor PgeF [Alphaproteobacteria bacterium]MBL6947606.1 peptidoglycan editing factor PgeF [Rhodospirillales bacterium]